MSSASARSASSHTGTIQLKSKREVNLELINTIIDEHDGKIKNIYKYTYANGCVSFFETSDTQKYISIVETNDLFIINLTNEDFDDEIKEMKYKLNAEDLSILTTLPLRKLGRDGILKRMEIYKPYQSIKSILNTDTDCVNEIELENAKNELTKLNTKLGCIDYKLAIDYVFKMENNTEITSYAFKADSLILCLFTKNKCISSLQINYKNEDGTIKIDSRTKKEYEGKKINTLLRSVIILISKKLFPDSMYISSIPINSISKNIMTKYFNAICFDDIECFIELNEENIKNAYNIFNKITQENVLKCTKQRRKKSPNTKRKKEKRNKSKSKH